LILKGEILLEKKERMRCGRKRSKGTRNGDKEKEVNLIISFVCFRPYLKFIRFLLFFPSLLSINSPL